MRLRKEKRLSGPLRMSFQASRFPHFCFRKALSEKTLLLKKVHLLPNLTGFGWLVVFYRLR